MQHSQPQHHSTASATDRFIQVGHFALYLHNPDESTSAFFQVSHYVFRINFFTASPCISSRCLVTIPQHYRVRALHFRRQPLPYPQTTNSPAAPISHFVTIPQFNNSLLNISSINSFKLPLRDSFPINRFPINHLPRHR